VHISRWLCLPFWWCSCCSCCSSSTTITTTNTTSRRSVECDDDSDCLRFCGWKKRNDRPRRMARTSAGEPGGAGAEARWGGGRGAEASTTRQAADRLTRPVPAGRRLPGCSIPILNCLALGCTGARGERCAANRTPILMPLAGKQAASAAWYSTGAYLAFPSHPIPTNLTTAVQMSERRSNQQTL